MPRRAAGAFLRKPSMSHLAIASQDDLRCSICGLEVCDGHEPTVRHPRFQTADEILNEQAPAEVIEGLAHVGRVTTLVGAPNTSKTFIALGASGNVSAGQPWCGRAVYAGSVAYVCFESDALGLRLLALKEGQGHHLRNFYLLRADDHRDRD